MLEGNGTVSPREYLDLVVFATKSEKNTLIISHLMRQMVAIYWSLLTPEGRMEVAPVLEDALWAQVNSDSHDMGIQRIYLRNYANIALTEGALENVKGVWSKELDYDHLKLGTRDYTNIAASLAIKLPEEAELIIALQADRVNGLDSQRRFEFISFALSPDQETRDKFFDALMHVENRHTEEWVLAALSYLHHPLRQQNSEKYLLRSLDILQDIQITGDIFFPGRWLSATFRYYQSDRAVEIVENFLARRPDYNYQLRLKILQETDRLLRANRILKRDTL